MGFHETLGVPVTATIEEITKAYRRKAKEHHPDRCPGDDDAQRRFCDIQNAYEALTNPNYKPPRKPTPPPRPRPQRSKDDWIKDAPPPTHDIWGDPINGFVEKPRPKPRRPAPKPTPKPEPEVDLWKTMESKSSRLQKSYWQEYDRLKVAMAYEDPDKFWEALDEWTRKHK